MIHKKLLSLLVLLMTVASGAWAQWTGGTYTATGNENLNTINVSDNATLTINPNVTVTVNGGIVVASGKTLTITGSGTLVANGAEGELGANGQTGTPGGTAIAGNVIINGVGLTVTATGGKGGDGGRGDYGSHGGSEGETGGIGGNGGNGANAGSAFSDAVTIYAGSVTATGGLGGRGGDGGQGGQGGEGGDGGRGGNGGYGGDGGYAFAGTLTVYGGNVSASGGYGGNTGDSGYGGEPGIGPSGNGYPGYPGEPGSMFGATGYAYANSVTFEVATYTVKDNYGNPIDINNITSQREVIIESADAEPAPTGPEVTTNAAQAGDFFTEATFAMPDYDATANYDIVRDMSDATYPVRFSGLAERVVVKKGSDDKYQPVTTLTIQLIDDISGSDVDIFSADGITINVLKGTKNNGTITYDDPVAYDDFTTNWQPGLYMLVAVPTDPATSPYTGTASWAFEALAGFPVEVAAKEYVTYYSATDNLALEENAGAKLYTITAVSGSTATATEITSANKKMPFLVYNSSDKDKTIILIPTDATINQTVAREFVGTATATTIAASTATLSNYALNGKQFVYVKNALDVAANKAWLAIGGQLHAPALNIVFDDNNMTAIDSMVNGQSSMDNGDWYDLNGRKLNAKPTTKGVYIQNGKKVVIK